MSNRVKFILLFLALFAFRTLFGLSQPFFSPDELQTYLIGLKWYCHGGWPYFGPDLIVTETGFYTQIPGPLEAWMIGVPLALWSVPEAPFLFLNLLSTGVIAWLAWYLSKRLPEIPFPFLFAWIGLLPWNLHESTNPINPSYLLIGSTFFFIGFLEAVPSLSKRYLPPAAAFALMGLGLFWDMEFHNSWLLLPPFVALTLVLRAKERLSFLARDVFWFLAGCAPGVALLAPTYLKYGFSQSAGEFHLAQAFNLKNFLAFFTILFRFFSLPCFETPRFIGAHTAERWNFLLHPPWLLLPGVFMVLMGGIQLLSLLTMGWFKNRQHKEASMIGAITLCAFLCVWVSFWFTSKEPLAHIYYVLMPLLVVYSAYAWSLLASHRRWRLFAVVCLGANLWFLSGYLMNVWKTQSLYLNRAQVEKAIQLKDDRVLGERRPKALY